MQREFQFYIVPTPIGNIEDITLRAIDVLKSVDIIACEDTRTTQSLLYKYNIKTKTVSFHKFNEKSKVDEFISMLKNGKKIALVSDAGTPMICDPGSILISELRKNNISITSLAGACAVSTFLSGIPRENEYFSFIGFFPKTSEIAKEIFCKYADTNLIFYESPNRIVETLKLIKEIRGEVKIALSRELTKLYEETVIDSISKVIEYFSSGIKGEIVCMVYPNEKSDEFLFKTKIQSLKDKGFKSKEIATILSTLYDINKNEVYKLSLE